mgnify:FL=1
MMTRLRSIVQHNLPVKIAALIVAVVLWLYVMNDQNPAIDGSYTVPVTIENAPNGYLMNAADDTVTIRVRGSRSLFVSADASDFHARVNLSDFIEGDKLYAVETVIPYGFELVSVSPDKIDVNLDRMVQKTFKAALTVGGSPASGFTVDKVTQENEAVTVEGPRSLVNQVAHIAGHINLSGQSSDYTATVPLFALNSDGREVAGITLTPSATEISVKLVRGLTRKVVEVQAHPQSDLAPNLKLEGVTVEPARIEIAGTEDVVSKITSIGTEEFSLAQVRETEKRQVKLVLPAGVTAADSNVTVEIKVGALQ